MENTILLKAGVETGVRLELEGIDVKKIENMSVTDILCNISAIRPAGFLSSCFYKNLLLIDSNLPLMYMSLVYQYYKNGEQEHRLKQLLLWMTERNAMGFLEKWLYEDKLKRLMMEAALGMNAEKEWDGGYQHIVRSILLEKDGKCYRFNGGEKQAFGRFLVDNCEVYGAGEEDGLEMVYEQDGRKYINLALNIVI